MRPLNPLRRLREAGQSVWLDFLRRGFTRSGSLERLVREDGLAGVTSNPTIFRKAIGGSTDYDAAIRDAAAAGRSDARDLFLDLAVADIREAAAVLRPVYDESAGDDGFVSYELEAELSRDAEGSVRAATEIFGRIGEPNVMIKVAGTGAGARAVEELVARGVNVNITLLFAVEAYERVALAYLAGLERRLKAGAPLDAVSSVASFFVSRVDSATDDLLPEGLPLRGRAAIANARLAYRRFREIFAGERWRQLERAGARRQRVLWASTSTKSPEYADVLYVEELVGPDTVNTMTADTMNAFRDHGRVNPHAVERGVDEAEAHLAALAGHGIDMDEITTGLLEAGIDSFASDFSALLETLEEKLAAMAGGRARRRAALGPLGGAVADGLASLERDDVIERIWRKDHTVWRPDPAEIADRLGWLRVAGLMRDRVAGLEAFAKHAAADGLTHAVLCGMGGSSLGPEVIRRTLGVAGGALELVVLDTTHPAAIARLERELDLDRTLFVIASKSGTTVETRSHLAWAWARTGRGDRFAAITDAGTPLEAEARERGFRGLFLSRADIGGRFSVLSPFGLVPAALVGADLHRMIDDAEQAACGCESCVPSDDNDAAWLGVVLGEAARGGRDKLTIVLPPAVASLGAWIEQLVAESTGKDGTGILPVVDEPLGPPAAYGSDRLFVVAGEHPALDELERAGHPVVRTADPGPGGLGGEFFRWELATAVAGAILGINPFDQPNVAEAKEATAAILAGAPAEPAGFDDPAPLLDRVRPGDYVAIQAFVDPTADNSERLQHARIALRDRLRVATTLGFGPRYLHSTGQLHKGGPDTGVFLQVLDARDTDVPVPGEAYTFGALIDAQALGDLRSLRAKGRRVARVTLDRLAEVAG